MQRWVLSTILLALIVIVLGAYTRLTDAGLGCPDWPGCYGHWTVPQDEQHVEHAELHFPDRPLEAHKAWNEMIHRYAASTLGFLVFVLLVKSIRRRDHTAPLKLPISLFVLVCFQGLLGMWTVTMNLMPLIVMGHLLGGFGLLSGLFLLYLRVRPWRIPSGDQGVSSLRPFVLLGLGLVVVQIGLGGWTSANYAALVCTEFPVCETNWWQRWDIAGAFSIPDAVNYEYGAHDYDDRMTMHILHRFGAVVVSVYLVFLALMVLRKARSDLVCQQVWLMLFLLLSQVALGVSNIVFTLPLPIAVMHNLTAACLLLSLVLLSYTLHRKV